MYLIPPYICLCVYLYISIWVKYWCLWSCHFILKLLFAQEWKIAYQYECTLSWCFVTKYEMAPLAYIRTVNVTNDKRAFCANIRIIIVCIESEWARTQCKYRCFCILSDVLAKQVACYCYKMLSKSRTIFLGLSVAAAYVTWGLLISLQPPFYPSEAEKKGATPSQVKTLLRYNECTKPYNWFWK